MLFVTERLEMFLPVSQLSIGDATAVNLLAVSLSEDPAL